MKRSDTGDFCVLYIEPDDEKESIFRVISEQKKPIVIMLMGRGQRSEPPGERPEMRVFQRPEDFAELKHLRRHLGVPVLFVISGSESLIHTGVISALSSSAAACRRARPEGPFRSIPSTRQLCSAGPCLC